MGEHTIREVLKRRSDDTQRVIRRRRERATKRSAAKHTSQGVLIALMITVLVILAALGYMGWLTHEIDSHFVADRTANALGRNRVTLNLQTTTQFLPNTLLAAMDPNFYNNSNMTLSPLTSRLVRGYFPDASAPSIATMSVALQLRYSRTDILEAFINDVNLGRHNGQPVRGFAAASLVYFKKPFVQLQPQDIALLVALAADPGDVEFLGNQDKVLALRNAILQMDAQQNVLSQTQVDALKKSPLDLAP